MSNFSGNTHARRQPVIDYDRQFQEDLERAQALSLESLALEKFRLQKEELEYTRHGNRSYNSSPIGRNGDGNDGANQGENDGTPLSNR